MPTVLSCWKDIARYLNRGVRTVQRWEREQHLPVYRVGTGPRSPVYAYCSEVDAWLRSQVNHGARTRKAEYKQTHILADIRQRASAAMERTKRTGSTFMWLELQTGRQLAKLALTSTRDSSADRRRQLARTAYDTLQDYVSRKVPLPKTELKNLHEELREFRRELEELGEVFHT